MLEKFRSSARHKLQRAVAEVVAESSNRQQDIDQARHAELLDRLSAELGRTRSELAAVRENLTELEQRVRRDITYALDIRATEQSAAFVLEHMPKVPVFWDPHDTLRYALDQVKIDGLTLEFGVAGGTTLRIIADALAGSDHNVFGFDVFSGLPETWRTGFPAGEFAQETLPQVSGTDLVPGLFEDTLPGFLAAHLGPIAFLHLDADLYSSTKTVLDLVGTRLISGSVIMFDEFFNYPGWQEHEYRAWTELVERTAVQFEYLAYTANNEQVVVRLV